jgi:four helix bundle protein
VALAVSAVKINRFSDLTVWQKAHELTLAAYKLAASFPRSEQFGIVSQLRRSATSVSANIAEGYRKRQYPKMFVSKIADADGETAETQVWLDFCCFFGILKFQNWGGLRLFSSE